MNTRQHDTLIAVKVAQLELQEILGEQAAAVAIAAPDLVALEDSRKTVARQLQRIRAELVRARRDAKAARAHFAAAVQIARTALDEANKVRREYLATKKGLVTDGCSE